MNIFREHVGFWTESRKKSLYRGILFLVFALFTQFFAGRYSVKSATNFVGDMFLDNLPTVNLNYVIIQGSFLMVLLVIAILAVKPRYILFSLKVIPFFIVIRSFFVSLTHLGIYPEQISLGTSFIDRVYSLLNLQDGFFFSGHTGLPFLVAMIFWQDKFWRFFFIGVSALFAVSVLLAHVHYSIDVFAAPFMTYAIFKLAQQELFTADYAVLREHAAS